MSAPAPALTKTLKLVPPPRKEGRPKLVELLDSVEAILDTMDGLDDADVQAREELSEQLIAKLAGTKEKIDATCGVLAAFESAEAAAKLERDRLDARMKYFARQTERLETHLLAVLEASKLDRIDGRISSLRRKKNPAKVLIDCEESIPWEFMRLPPPPPPPPPPAPDKAAIAKALKADPEAVPGCRLEAGFRLVRS